MHPTSDDLLWSNLKMSDEYVLSILRCRECNKPFDKREFYITSNWKFLCGTKLVYLLANNVAASTLKRHGYYCRSRKAAAPPARSRSCISCARGKARCDNKRPGCSRCIARAIQCQYPANKPRNMESKIQSSDNGPIGQRIAIPSLTVSSSSAENDQESSNDSDINLDRAPIISDPVFTYIGDDYLDFDDPQIDLAGIFNQQSNVGTVQYPPLGSSASARHWIPLTNQTLHTSFSPYISIPKQPTTTFRSLIQRPKLSSGAQRIANLILHTLKSYPLMMLRYSSLPPFIHPRLISSEAEDNHMEPLTNCICLVHMISSGIRGSRKLFWKNVQMECERMCEEVSSYSSYAPIRGSRRS